LSTKTASIEIVQKAADIRTNYEIAQKIEGFIESTKNKSKDTNLVFDISFLALLIVGLFRRYQFINKTKKK
jgi:hypothetical protein